MFFDGWGFRENLRKLVAKINKQKKALKKSPAQVQNQADHGR